MKNGFNHEQNKRNEEMLKSGPQYTPQLPQTTYVATVTYTKRRRTLFAALIRIVGFFLALTLCALASLAVFSPDMLRLLLGL